MQSPGRYASCIAGLHQKYHMSINPIIAFISLFFIFASCHNTKSKDNVLLVPIDPNKVIIVNHRDENGKKQGRWQEDGTVNNRIAKDYFYKNDLLDSSYLVYKANSADTLIFGSYKLGKKHGEWKYWDSASNRINRLERYENDILKETKKLRQLN